MRRPVLPRKPERRKKPRRKRKGNMKQIPQMTVTTMNAMKNERKRRLAQADADSEITDRMIAQAEARNQAKKAKLNLC